MSQKSEAARFRELLLAGDASGGAKRNDDADGEDDEEPAAGGARAPESGDAHRHTRREGDMVVTFGVGLEERIAAKRAATSQAPETVWQAHLRDRKEKKRAGKSAAAEGDEEAGAPAGADDLGFQDPFFASVDDGARATEERGRKREKKGAAAAAAVLDPAAASEEARRRAELELLLLDDARLKAGAAPLVARKRAGAAAAPAADAQPLSRKEARVAAKASRRAARLARESGGADEGEEGGGALDTADARFSSLFTRPEFALDPTDSRFKAVRGVDTIRREAASRRAAASGEAARVADGAPEVGGELGSVVARLKRKAGARL